MNIIDTVNPVYGFNVSFYADDRYIGQHMLGTKGIERVETELFVSLLQPNTLVLDVGANLGWYSLVFAQTMRDRHWNGLAIGFEPESTNYNLFLRNIRSNGFADLIHPEQLALGNESTIMPIWLSIDADGNYINRGDHRLNQGSRTQCEDVQVLPLDWYMDSFGLGHYDNYILKVDVQGFEYRVLQGAEHFLSTNRPLHLLIEFNRGTGASHFDFIKAHFGKIQILGGDEAQSFDDIVAFCEAKKHTHANLYASKT